MSSEPRKNGAGNVLAELDETLAGGQPKRMTITPAIAQEIMVSRNKKNRTVTPGTVARLADAMAKGEWKRNSATVAFYPSGDLADGQHRCHAAIKSNCSFETIVVPNFEDGAIDTIDIGKSRTAADALLMQGVERPHDMARTAELVLAWTLTGTPAGPKPSIQQIENYVKEHGADLLECVKKAIDIHDEYGKLIPLPELAAVRLVGKHMGTDLVKLDAYFAAVCTGVASKPEAANLKLHTMLQKAKVAEKARDRISSKQRMAFLVEGFGYFLHDVSMGGGFKYGKGKSKEFPKFGSETA